MLPIVIFRSQLLFFHLLDEWWKKSYDDSEWDKGCVKGVLSLLSVFDRKINRNQDALPTHQFTLNAGYTFAYWCDVISRVKTCRKCLSKDESLREKRNMLVTDNIIIIIINIINIIINIKQSKKIV